MRLFVSVDLDGFEEAITSLQKPLSNVSEIRLADPADAHVTLQFLGDRDHDLGAVRDAIETAIEPPTVAPFKVTFDTVGAFPSAGYIRVIWMGVGRGAEALTTLHDRIVHETSALDYENEQYEFTPHVTLARMEHAGSKTAVKQFLVDTTPDIGPLQVAEVRLKESTLTDSGSTYRTIERFDL